MPNNNEQNGYIKPPVKALTRDLTEKYVKEIVKEAIRQVLKRKSDLDAEKLDQTWKNISEPDRERYLKALEEKIANNITGKVANEQDILREASNLLKNDLEPSKFLEPSQVFSPSSEKQDIQDQKAHKRKRSFKSILAKGFFALILIAVGSYFLLPIISPAQLAVSHTNLDFNLVPDKTTQSKYFTISNHGLGRLNWNIETEESWIDVSPTYGSIPPFSFSTNKLVRVAIQGSPSPGTHSGSVIVRSNGGKQTVHVNLQVQAPPNLSVNPLFLTFIKGFQEQPASQTLAISNTGEGTMNWSATADQSWMYLDKSEGTNNENIQVGITEPPGPGTYPGTISIKSNGGDRDIPITLEVRAPPKLAVSPNPLAFNFEDLYGYIVSHPKPQTFDIINDGQDALNWQISHDPWITVSPESGSLEGGNRKEVTVGIDTQNLELRDYPGSLTITSNGGSANSKVELRRRVTIG
jgi:hypothetical protein